MNTNGKTTLDIDAFLAMGREMKERLEKELAELEARAEEVRGHLALLGAPVKTKTERPAERRIEPRYVNEQTRRIQAAANGFLRAEQIAQNLGLDTRITRNALRRGEEYGTLVRVRRGVYAQAPNKAQETA